MRRSVSLHEWIQNEANQSAYQKWLDDPVTNTILEGVRPMQSQAIMPKPTAEEALQRIGFLAGRDSTVAAVRGLMDFVQTSDASSSKHERICYLIEVEGYTTERAARIAEMEGV